MKNKEPVYVAGVSSGLPFIYKIEAEDVGESDELPKMLKKATKLFDLRKDKNIDSLSRRVDFFMTLSESMKHCIKEMFESI